MLPILGLAVGGLFTYCLGGSLTVLATAYLHKRITGRNWFSSDESRRWVDDQSGSRWLLGMPPAVIFSLWWLAIPVSLLLFVVHGFFTITEKLGDRVIDAATEQRKKIGSYRENPK